MNDYNFSKSFLEIAYRAIMMNAFKGNEVETRKLNDLFEVCDKYNIPVKDFVDALTELNDRTADLTPHD